MPSLLSPSVAIACGGTGGHLYPGLAVAHELADRDVTVTLFVSAKEVDQKGVLSARGRFQVVTLPLVAFSPKNLWKFTKVTWTSLRQTSHEFNVRPPLAVLAMGGFTASAPVISGRRRGARIFLHESNTIPGRANRWLGRVAHVGCVGFPEAAHRWRVARICDTGTPVRREIREADSQASRQALGLRVDRPVLLITGGSQGAYGVNQLVLSGLAELNRRHPELQWVHLTGATGFSAVDEAYRRAGVPAKIFPFSQQMDLMLAASSVVVSRSGASSLAEFAARRIPSVLIPYPSAADDHQRYNAMAFARAGAARMLDQNVSDGAALVEAVDALLSTPGLHQQMSLALKELDRPAAAADLAQLILEDIKSRKSTHARPSGSEASSFPIRSV